MYVKGNTNIECVYLTIPDSIVTQTGYVSLDDNIMVDNNALRPQRPSLFRRLFRMIFQSNRGGFGDVNRGIGFESTMLPIGGHY